MATTKMQYVVDVDVLDDMVYLLEEFAVSGQYGKDDLYDCFIGELDTINKVLDAVGHDRGGKDMMDTVVVDTKVYEAMADFLEDVLRKGKLGKDVLYKWYQDNNLLIDNVLDNDAYMEFE